MTARTRPTAARPVLSVGFQSANAATRTCTVATTSPPQTPSPEANSATSATLPTLSLQLESHVLLRPVFCSDTPRSPILRLPAEPRAKVFISHSSKDEAVVRWLAAQVSAAGHEAWVAEWDPQPGEHLTNKVRKQLAECDAYVLLLTEEGYGSLYVAHESGAAVASGKPVIALVDNALAERPMGLLADIEQVRFDRNDLATCTAAITAGLVRFANKRGVQVEPNSIVMPTQPALSVSASR